MNIARLAIPVQNVLSTGIDASFGRNSSLIPLCDMLPTGQGSSDYFGSSLPTKLALIFFDRSHTKSMPGYAQPPPICATLVEQIRDAGT